VCAPFDIAAELFDEQFPIVNNDRSKRHLPSDICRTLIADATIVDFDLSLRIHRAPTVDLPRHFRYDAFDGTLIVRLRHAPRNAESGTKPSSTSKNSRMRITNSAIIGRMARALCLASLGFFSSLSLATEPVSIPTQTEVSRLHMLFETDQRAALDQLNALLQHLPSNASPGDRRLVLEQLISSSINAGRKEDALKFNDDLKTFGNRFQDARALALASNFEARMLQNDGKLEEAAIEIERALSLSQDANDKEVTFRVNILAGTININLGNFNSALRYQLAALGAVDGNDVESRLKRSAATYMIAKLYLALKNPQLSLEYNAKARDLTEQTNVPRTIVALAISRGDAYAAMNNKREAEKAYMEALSLARKISDRRQEAAALGSLADLAKQAARYADCASYALRAESVAEEAHIDSVKADAEISLGLCNIGLGSARQGREEIDRGMAFFRKASAKPELELALGQLADAYVKVGEFRPAVDALREQRTLAAELFQADRDRAAAKLQAQFDAKERQKQIGMLEQKNLLQDREIKIKNLQREIAVLAIFVVTAIALVLVWTTEKLRRLASRQNKEKSKFMADAAHDLRQPLHAMGNLLEAAKHAVVREDVSRSRELIDLAQSAMHAAQRSFDSVLEVSRLESGLMKPDYALFDLQELVRDVCDSQMPMAIERGVRIRLAFTAEKRRMARSDRHLLARAIGNLLSNAIKYADQSKGVRQGVVVGIVALPALWRVQIVDNGIGIAGAEQKNIFKPFYQVHNPERDREKGLGLGLSIVQSILALLKDHRIAMRSAEGKGTRFSIDIPRIADAGHVPPDRHARNDAVAQDLAGLYILIVEDDILVRRSTEALFQEYGILFEALDSVDALTRKLPALERMPDLVLTDFSLAANHSAIDVMQVVRAEFERDIPTIVLTGKSDNFADTQRNRLPGNILYKPVDPMILMNTIRELCTVRLNGN